MGFLKFLKRDKGREPDFELGDLDMPPPPPDFDKEDFGGRAEFPNAPKMPKAEEPFSEAEEKPFMGGKFPEEEYGAGLKTGPMPAFPKLKGDIQVKAPGPIPRLKPMFSAQPKPVFERIPLEEELKLEAPKVEIPEIKLYREDKPGFKEERVVPKRKETGGPIFIRVDNFRDIITKINTMKNDSKIAVHSIEKLNEANLNMEKIFESWHGVMNDLQKKLVFMDNTLFKG
ncbi:hypothetical protein KY347_00570 [Candidatus Woesearchaeota archaeon]|nr:hypothetical protein [Candidatus Woesearchaeota archaeon]